MEITIDGTQRFWMLALLVIWAVLLFGGFAFGKDNAEQTHRIPAWMRMASSAALVAAGWSWYFFQRGTDIERLTLFFALGMTFGLLGDLFMAEVIPFGDRVLGGIIAFGVGHVVYIVGMMGFGNQYGFTGQRWAALIVWLIIGAIAWFFAVYRGSEATVLHFVALPYALLLAGTAGIATGLALQTSEFALVAVGGALFLFSDLLLATQIFNNLHFRLIGDVVWLMYGPGQMLIVYGVALRTMF